jgi:hypothetical protein
VKISNFESNSRTPETGPRAKGPERAGFFGSCLSPNNSDRTGWLAQQCRWSPALPVFPANREFNREFCKNAASETTETANNSLVTGLPTRIPYSMKRGIFWRNRESWCENREFIGRNFGSVPTDVCSYSNRWGNRPALLWIAEDFGCCASG